MKRPAFWILLGALALAASATAWHFFPRAFSIVALDIRMDRDDALAAARSIMTRDALGPSGYRQAASFALDEETQTFVELEGGGKEAFTRMLRDGLYAAYTWRVRQFREAETNETLIRFTPDGQPYGLVERLKEDAPGATLTGADARRRAEADASAKWGIDFRKYTLVEAGQERRPGGRVDHTLTYERPEPTLNEGRYRLRLIVSGDRLTEVTHFVKIPEAFTRRYASMRSANAVIGIGSLVGVLIYIVGGIGVGLFFMLRRRWVLWRHAAFWGVAVAALQVLAAINEWPLMWMTYDTALPRSTFIGQQIATLAATFVGFSVFFALSFMAAETLTRRAFGAHPQLWRVWSRGPGSSTAILGRTAGAYLLVPMFFAYDVLLYLVATRAFGWWTPSEALLHPDVLATYVPWLSAIANSFQAGFWEESLFRAVPIAGAALIGDRFGNRRLFVVIAFVVQSLIFGAGHAPYPTQPSFARPVELILPSIGFGLLYLYFGLLPGIILHFTFDVIWFALPIFLAEGIWTQKLMIVLMTLVPLWVVVWRRVQAGAWTELAPADRNAAWQPPPASEVVEARPVPGGMQVLGRRSRAVWLGIGAASLAVCAVALLTGDRPRSLDVGRAEAATLARQALEQRGVKVENPWRVLPTPDDGSSDTQEFVAETAGNERRVQLLGTYLPQPRWIVRVAKFEGDEVERAEEWRVIVGRDRVARSLQHTLPEQRPGPSLEEEPARRLAQQALLKTAGLDVTQSQAREVSARSSKLKARTDWTFTFVDTTIPPLPKGEPRVRVELAGDEVAHVGRFVFVPEDWERQQRARATRDLIIRIVSGTIYGGLLVAAGVVGVVLWSRKRYAARVFVAAAGVMLVASILNGVNGWPAMLASLPTEVPLRASIALLVGGAVVGLTIVALLIGLATGALPHRLSASAELSDREALQLGIAAGLFGSGVSLVAAVLRTPGWAHAPYVAPLGTAVPFGGLALETVPTFLMRTAVVMSVLTIVDILTGGWTRRRALAGVALLLIGFFGAGGPEGAHLGGWLAAGLLTAAALVVVYVTLLRADLSMVPISVGVMTAVGVLARGSQRPFPGALLASIVGALLVLAVAWWWFNMLRRARARARGAVPAGPVTLESV